MFKIAYHTNYTHKVPENHRFPMIKYELLYEQLLLENIAEKTDFFTPDIVEISDTFLAHRQEYVEAFVNLSLTESQARKIGFIQDKELINRELTLVQGTISGALLAFENKIAFNIAGGTHHAYSDRGEAFCMLNDQAIASTFFPCLSKELMYSSSFSNNSIIFHLFFLEFSILIIYSYIIFFKIFF